jgi:hypothetical protein
MLRNSYALFSRAVTKADHLKESDAIGDDMPLWRIDRDRKSVRLGYSSRPGESLRDCGEGEANMAEQLVDYVLLESRPYDLISIAGRTYQKHREVADVYVHPGK